ncbi:hypothetical protein Tcan_08912 [Toxocara canis]|uniref:Uncharacterized protein n=1 Tax=Toxocara canis TaxID=6265 RepID=A0A0B2W379_TOXCA|nr:hypothetical protein Tcan_08912 [Toxocara canis]
MKPFLALLFIALCRCAIVTSLVTRYPLTRAQRDTRLNASIGFTEIRQRIAKIVANITKYSEKVQNGISQMDVHKHNLNEESSEALVKQKLIADQRRSLQQQLLALANDVTATKQQLDDINVRISKEAEDVRNAEDDLNEKREEKPKWYCVWKCRKKWKKVQQERVEDAEAVGIS